MTSTYQTSSGGVANLVSSSPELLTRPASKPDDRSNSSTGELCTLTSMARLGTAIKVRGFTAFSLFAYFVYFVVKQVPNRDRLSLDFPKRNQFLKLNARSGFEISPLFGVSVLSQHFCDIQGVDFAAFSRFLQITRNVLNPEVQSERPSEIVVKKAETALRFAETSQQTLRQILLLPTTYINFAEKNSLKSKLLRHLRHTTIVDSNFVAPAARTEGQGEDVLASPCSACSAYLFEKIAAPRGRSALIQHFI
jgi:hypothetical protein